MGFQLAAAGILGDSGSNVVFQAGGSADLIDFADSSGTVFAQFDPANAQAKIDTIAEYTSDNGITIDGVILKDNEVSTDVINELSAAAGVTIDGVLLKDSEVSVDTINEQTATAGVTIDGVLLKDNEVNTDVINELSAGVGVTIDGVLLKDNDVEATEVRSDTISEKTADAGVTIDGVLLKDNAVNVDNITEKTGGAGVTIDGVLIQDSRVDGVLFTEIASGFQATSGFSTQKTFSFSNDTLTLDGSVLTLTMNCTLDQNLATTSTPTFAGASLTGNLAMGTNKITGLGTPTADTDAATKAYVDGIAAGLDPKESVRLASTSAMASWGAAGSGVGKTLTAPDNSTSYNDFDGVTAALGDRILVRTGGPNDDVDNGIYTVTALGNGSDTSTELTRATDFDGSPSGEVSGGNFTFVEQGTDNSGKGYVVVADGDITVDTDTISWTQFSQASAYTGGDGIEITSGTISVDLNSQSGLGFAGGQLRIELASDPGLEIEFPSGELAVLLRNGASINKTSAGLWLDWSETGGGQQKAGVDDIASGVSSKAITFGDAFPSGVTPVVTFSLYNSGTPSAVITGYISAVSNTGFTVTFTGDTADANWDLHWQAVNPTSTIADV